MTRAALLFAHHGLDWITGSERCLLDLVEHLDRDRYRPVVVCNSPALAAAARDLGARVYAGAQYESPDALFPPVRLRAAAARILREERIALVHANDFDPVKWLLPAARSARVPMVLHVHLPSTEDERCYNFTHQATRVVGVSRAAVAGFLADGLAPAQTTVIYNGVDPGRLQSGDATRLRAELGIAPDETVVAGVGSLIRRKGFDVTLRAAAALRGSHRLRLLILGDGPERDALGVLTGTLALGDRVAFLGRRPDAGAVLRDVADIVVSAAREESFGLNVIEAGFFALPVVATDIPPHREIIDHERSGLLFAVDDWRALAAALGTLADAPARRRALGQTLAARVRQRFMIDRYVRSFTELYEELLAAPHRRYGWFGEWRWPRAYTRWLWRKMNAAARLPASARATAGRP